MLAADAIPVPSNIRWLVDLVGPDAAMHLVETYGGTRLFVPKTVSGKSEIVKHTKLDAKTLQPLARARGGENIKLPMCREWRVRVYRARDNASYAAIARRLRIGEDAVWRILNAGGMTATQFQLPL